MSWDIYRHPGHLVERGDDTTRTVTTYDETGAITGSRPYDEDENAVADAAVAAAAHTAAVAAIRDDLVSKAIAWLEADADQATARAAVIAARIATAQTRQQQAQAFTFNGSTVAGINTQLNGSLKPLLVDMLAYIIGLGQVVQGIETWRGDRADPALIWLARHQTDTV